MKKRINWQLKRLVTLTDNKKLAVDYSTYGGYRLIEVCEKGSEFGVFGESSCCPRMKAKEFSTYLNGLINGIEYQIKIELGISKQ